MTDPKFRSVASPELRHVRKSRVSEMQLQTKCEVEDRLSARSQRQIDKQMLQARRQLVDINARTPTPRRLSMDAPGSTVKRTSLVPEISVCSARDPSANSSHGSLNQMSGEEDAVDAGLLGPKTKRNLAISKKLSRSLEVMSQKREMSPQRGKGQNAAGLSPRAINDLQKAAQVLKYTKHDAMVQELLASVTSTSPKS